MSYVAIGKALYDYTAQADDELNLTEDEGLYILDNSDPEWWKAKRRPPIDENGHPQPSASSEEQEVGLVPANYVEEAEPLRMSRALYDYEKQNEDELDVQEDELLRVYEYEGEWLLVKRQGSDGIGTGEGKLGFVPANYVDEVAAVDGGPTQVNTAQAQAEAAEDEEEEDDGPSGAIGTAPPMRTISVQPAGGAPSALDTAAGTPKGKADDISMWAASALDGKKKKKKGTLGIGNASLFFASESDKTPVQKIPVLSILSHSVEKGKTVLLKLYDDVETELLEGKDPEDKTVAFLASSKGDAEAISKKLDFSKQLARENPPPPKSAGAAPPAAAVTTSGTPRAVPPPSANGSATAGSRTVPSAPAPPPAAAATGSSAILPPPVRKNVSFNSAAASTPSASASAPSSKPAPALASGEEQGIALYDFEAQGDDELSVVENEKLVIVERENDDWWKVRNEAGQEGVVPASYVEATPEDAAGGASAMANGEQEDVDEEELERQRNEEEMAAIQAAEADRQKAARAAEMERRKKELVEKRRREEAEAKRREALKAQPAPAVPTMDGRSRGDRDAREGRDVKIPSGRSAPERPRDGGRSKPSINNTRIWHDKSGQFKVEAEFLGFNQGKIRLHKLNGVVIEVAIEKMSHPDIQFLEDITGKRLMPGDDDVPLSRAVEQRRRESAVRGAGPAAVSGRQREPEREREKRKEKERERDARQRQEGRSRRNVDWFEFFLAAGVDLDDCTRYAAAFERDKIDEAVLPEMDAGVLRSLGLREGDIIRVVKLIERKYKPRNESASNSKEKQIRKDEELARKLQEEEQNAKRGKNASPAPQLFSGPDGSLKNNTRRGRPTPSASRQGTSVDAASLASATESLRLNTASPLSRTATTSPESSRRTPATAGFDDDAWTPRPPSVKPMTPAAPAAPPTPSPAPPAPAAQPVVASPPPAPTPPALPAAAPVEPPKPPADPNSALFDKLAAMKAASPAPSFDRPGANPMNGSMLGGYQGPRGPLAPVPGNQGLLHPLIPTQGTGQFVPTRQMPMQTGMQPQMTGWGGMQPQQTGWGGVQGMQPQSTGFVGGMNMQAQPTGFSQQQFGMQMQPTGYGGMQPQQQMQPQSTFGMLSAQAQHEEKEKDMTPSNIFAQMKSGQFAKDGNTDVQPAEKYDALRGWNSGGIVAQPTGFQQPQQTGFQYPQQTGFGGYQYPQQTGYPGGYGYQ